MSSKNESLWLASGMAGENQARALNLPLEFTRIVVGDANGSYPPMDNTITALVNERITGQVLAHRIDPYDSQQRIVDMAIPPSLDFDAVEILLYGKYGETEFPHTYFRLAAPYPIRTLENGGSQASLKFTIRVDASSNFTIFAMPDMTYVTNEQLAQVTDELGNQLGELTATSVGALSSKGGIIDNGENTTLTIKSGDSGISTLELLGDVQGTGMVYLGQSTIFGGGVLYNGDGTPNSAGEVDHLVFYRREYSKDYWTAKNPVLSNDWFFRGDIYAQEDKKVYHEGNKPSATDLSLVKTYQNSPSISILREALETQVYYSAVEPVVYTLEESTFEIGDKVIIDRLTPLAGVLTITTDSGMIIGPKGIGIGATITMSGPAFKVILHKAEAEKWVMQVINTGGSL